MILTARLLFLLSFLGFLAQGQNPLELVPGTRVDVLLELADSFKVRATRERAEAEAFAREHGLPIRMEDSLQTIEIRRIENGLPLYNTVDNLTAAYTLNTDDLWNGGVLGLNIEGQNMVVGEWDGGAVLTNHQEFMPPTGGSRAIQQDGATTVNYHATHVAGTLIAEGQVNAARGMANQATLHAYDWYNDNSEMATAAANGLLVSNHSYGSVSGWHYNSSLSRYEWWGISTDTEDYKFGQYSYDAAAWDGIAYNAPYYLIVKSAGNDRGDSGADPYYVYSGSSWVLSTQPSSFREIDGGTDGFDCITTNGNAKNILTVGAVGDISTGWSQASDVSMSSFSGWGPTDDGRIKPDVVGNGIGLYSTYDTNTSSYASLNGTSMAAPNVTGSLILLQQLHLNSIGTYMRSATLKGLVIHTTNEAGSNPGPDYSHGWGLVDMNGAAQIILDQASNDIVESTLNNAGTYTYSVVSDGITPISATLCWTDPAGTSQSAVLNETTSRLVNDLDMVITNGSATWQPWILDPANPANAATTGNNARDNVEKIEAGVLPAGSYTIVVSHKGTLSGGSQNFSMIISGLSGVPSADFTVSQSSLCPGDTISLTSTSTGGATQFAWSISPATGWSFVNGTNANSQNPQVEFTATSGFYAVTLVASNSFGSGSITTDSVIKVGGYLLPYTNNLETSALRDEIEIINNDGNTAWVYSTNAVNGTSLSFNNFTNNNTGSFDWAVLPPLDLSNLSSAQLEFDYAYSAYSSSYSDTLIVAVSTSCGTTYTPVFYQGGVALQTTSAFTQSTFDPSTNADWCDGGTTACPTVDLAPYVGQSGVRIGFINKSGWGNNMYVDNIQVTGTASATPMSISGSQITHVACNGDLSGGIQIAVTGGTSPYNYAWSNGATSASISGIGAGTYGVTITDQLAQQVTGSYQVTEPSTLSASASGNDESISGWADGSATVSVSGGSSPYSYAWSNGGTTAFISNLSPATYTVTATDNNSCSVTASVVIGAGVDSLKISSASVQDLDCYQDGSGSVAVSITGGSAPYNYSWSNGATTSSISGLAAGSYQLTVTDGSGQHATGNYSVSEPAALTVAVNGVDESINGYLDGSASSSATGGTAPYSYSWSNGATNSSIANLGPGSYTITITDANNCVTTGSTTIAAGVDTLKITSVTLSNLTCNSDASGSIIPQITGGTTPYAFSWSSGATSSSLIGLDAGTYGFSVSDGSGQSVSGSYTLTEPTAVNVSTSTTNESVTGAQDGSASVSASGGTPPYTYSWSNGATSASISNLAPGNYLYTVTDANLCTSSGSVTVQQGVAVLNISGATVQDLLCYQDGSGGVAVTVTGGTAPYNYVWSNGATAPSISGLAAGSYQVTVTDGSGQQATGSYTVSEPSALSGLLAVNNQTVVSQNDGSIAALIQGGTPYVLGSAYQYNWSNGGTAAQITNLSPGTYTLTVTDSLGCTLTLIDSVETGADLMNIVGLIHTVSCAGGSDGSVDAQIIGGQAPYTYLWSNGATTQDISGLAAGFYTLSASDAVGQSDVQNFLVAEPLPITLAVSSQDESVQGYADGTANASITGGTPPYSYSWSNGATTAQIANLSPGTYAITLTDANNCSAIDSATIAAGVPVLQWSIQVSDVTCNDGSDGSIAIATTGGAAPIVFAWSNGSSTSTLSNLTAGTYAVTATDALGQSLDSVLVVQQPSALSIALVTSDESIQGLADGSVSAGVSGGSAGYAYAWSNGATTAQIANLSPGTYTLTVTDAVGCTATNSATINPGVPVLTANALVNHVSCNGLMDGSIALQVSGGTVPIAIVWSNGDTSATISNLGPGTYNYTVTDGIGQVATGSGTIVEPPALTASTVVTDESIQGLQDGSVSVLVAGGTSPYQYLWSNGLTMSTLNNLGPGYYTCTITDQNGCVTTVGDTVFDGIPVLQDFTTYLHPACYGDSSGSISVAASGGVPPYAWNWSTGDTATSLQGLAAGLYYLTLSDQSGQSVVDSVQLVYPFALSITGTAYAESIANYADGAAAVQGGGGVPPYSWLWSTGATVDSISGLAAGTYTVTITDHNNCTAIDTLIVAPGVDTLSISISASNPDCFGGTNGSIDLTTNGGLLPFIYQWSHGGIIQDPFGLAANTYFVTVTDALGQVATGSITLVDPPLLQVQLSTMDESVAGYQDGSASALVLGGTLPYSYLWSTGATSDSIGGLAAGVYTLTVTDSLGCSAVVSDTVSTGVPVLQSSVQGQNILCFGGLNGVASIAVVGGASPYSFQWSNGSTSATITGVSAGTYLYTVTDAVGQTDAGSITLNEPTALSVPASITHETVTGQNDGSISLAPSGGTPPYSVLWSTGSSANPLQNLAPGDYITTITDANGCSATDTLTVLSGAALLAVTDTITDESCANSGNGSIALTVTGGIPPYNYIWSNGATGSAVLNLSAGNYGVTVTDGSGQTWTNSYAVSAPAALVLTGSTVNPSGFGLADGSISISIAGGSPGYVFSWSDGSSLSSRVGLMAGTYGLTVTDNQGCSATGSWTLTDPAPPALSHSLSIVDVSCFDGSDGWVTVSAVGGVGPYSIVWADGSTLFSLSGLTAGSYAFTVSDGAGQQSVGSAVISQPSELMVQAFEGSPGNLYAVVSGGAYPYTYSWNTSPILTDSAISVPMGAEYEVVVTDANGCMADAFVTSTLSLETWRLKVQVYPNPGRDALWLSSDGQMDQVRVMDARGRTVYWLMDGASESLEINTSTWAMGTYYIQIESRGYTRVVKWVLNR